MALNYYSNYIANIAKTPNQYYIDTMQASIDSMWDNSTQNHFVLTQQNSIGSNVYDSVQVSVDMQIDMGTGLKKSDDWKVFTHKNLSDKTALGLMYKWDDNYWITTNTDEYASPIKSASVRRCNNFLKWINRENGALLSYPCVVDYDLSGTSPKYDKDVNTTNGHFVCIVQGNADTLALTQNQRFIFNGQAFKLTGYNNMLQNTMVDSRTTLLYLDMYMDTPKPYDDLVNNIANITEYNYSINILQDTTEQVSGFSGQLTAQVTLNGEIVTRPIEWSSNENGSITSSGAYTLIGGNSTQAKFTATLGDTKSTITINIVDVVVDKYDIVISPKPQELNQGDEIIISADLYKNGVIQTTTISATTSGADSSNCYEFVSLGNNKFKLINKLRSISPLVITFVTPQRSESISIKLKSMF